MAKSDEQKPKEGRSSKEPSSPSKRRRGRPEKLVKIDDSPRNVARALFGIPSSKFSGK